MNRVSFIAACVIFLSAFVYGLEDPEVDIATELGAEIVALVKGAQKVRAYCRDMERYGSSTNADAESLTDETTVRGQRVEELSTLLLGNETWSTIKKDCKPRWGYMLTFSDGKNYVDFWLCFECGMVEVRYHSVNPEKNKSVSLDMRKGAPLAKWIRETFPNDRRLGKLK